MQPESPGLDDCNVFVKYLPPELTEAEFHQMFKPFGSVISSKIMVDTTGKSLGYGFVRFSSPDVCKKAISAMNGRKVSNKRLLCKLANQSPASSPYGNENARNPILRQQLPSDNIYIKPLLLSTTEDDLMELFGKFGHISECKVMVDKNTGISHQIGFVRFGSTEEAKEAIQAMNGYKLHPSAVPLVVKYADTKEQKDARKSLRAQHSSSLDEFETGGYSPVFYYSPTTYAYSYPGTYMDDHYGNSPAASDYYVGSYPSAPQAFYAQPYYYEGMPGYYYEGYAAFGYEDGATPQPSEGTDVKDQPEATSTEGTPQPATPTPQPVTPPVIPPRGVKMHPQPQPGEHGAHGHPPMIPPRSKPRGTTQITDPAKAATQPHPANKPKTEEKKEEPAKEFRPASPMTPSIPININYDNSSD